jgi:hypothetical protein
MTNYSLKTGEVVQVENIMDILFMTDAEFNEWEASVMGTQQHGLSLDISKSEPRDWTGLEPLD